MMSCILRCLCECRHVVLAGVFFPFFVSFIEFVLIIRLETRLAIPGVPARIAVIVIAVVDSLSRYPPLL